MANPITFVPAAQQQHMLLLFVPIKKGTLKAALTNLTELSTLSSPVNGAKGSTPGDLRAATGVHFSFFYGLPADTTPGLPVPSFQTAPGKDLLVVQAIYDADFAPYISAFVNVPAIAFGLNAILSIADETGIIDPTNPTSAAYILQNGGVVANADSFNCWLMRYNFADPTIPAGLQPQPGQKYLLTGTFPGLTVGNILQNYPDAEQLWPSPAAVVTFAQSVAPVCDDN